MKMLLMLVSTTSLSIPLIAQNCDSSVLARKGVRLETVEYDGFQKVKSRSYQSVTSVEASATGVSSRIQTTKKDAEGNIQEVKNINYTCDAKGTYLSLGFEDRKNKKEAVMFYPANPVVSELIKENPSFQQEITNEKGERVRFSISLDKRVMSGREQKKTPAGVFDCMVYKYQLKTSLKIGVLSIPLVQNVTEWYSPSVGPVRVEYYSKEGKLQTYSELNSITSI